MPIVEVKQTGDQPTTSFQPVQVPNMMITSLLGEDVQKMTKQDRESLKFIEEYLNSQSDDEFERIKILRDIKYRLGAPEIGQTYTGTVARYIQLRQAARENEEMAKSLEQ